MNLSPSCSVFDEFGYEKWSGLRRQKALLTTENQQSHDVKFGSESGTPVLSEIEDHEVGFE
ncbi:hypothetical protein TorRG33x02_258350, partial [Trema orientale]